MTLNNFFITPLYDNLVLPWTYWKWNNEDTKFVHGDAIY